MAATVRHRVGGGDGNSVGWNLLVRLEWVPHLVVVLVRQRDHRRIQRPENRAFQTGVSESGRLMARSMRSGSERDLGITKSNR